MSKPDSWKDVAIALASRLEHSRDADHSPPDPDCPHCKDAQVFQRFERRLARDGGRIPRWGEGARSIPLHELRARTENGDTP